MIKAIIFDFDGVLAESSDIKTEAFARLFRDESPKAVRQIVRYHLRHSGVSRFNKFRYIYKNILKRPLDNKTFDRLCRNFSGLVYEAVVRAPFVKGAGEFLRAQRRKYKYFLVSATPCAEIKRIAAKKGIKHYFQNIFGSPIDKSSVTRRIILKYGFNPKEVVYVGDALSDLQAADKNSVNFIARIHKDSRRFFKDKKFPKIKDLTGLKSALSKY